MSRRRGFGRERRRMVGTGVIGVLAMTTLMACEPTTPDGRSDVRPNVLLIVTDDQPLGTMSAMPETTRLLRDEGTRFVNAFAATPNCCPSRASIMTGQYAHNHGVTQNSKALRLTQGETLQRRLHDAGYYNAAIGKFLNRWPIDKRPPHFDRWTTFSSSSNNDRYYSGGRWNIDGTVRQVDEYATSFVERKTLEYLEAAADSDQPWFLYVAPTAPHTDLQQLAQVEVSHQDDRVAEWHPGPSVGEENRADKPSFVRELNFEDEGGGRSREAQLRSLMSVDELVAGVFERLIELGLDRNTLVIYLSDNGYMWGQHGIVTKHFPYSESVRIPLFVRWPDMVEGGRVDRRLVSTVDVAPTVLDAVGIPFRPRPD
ncbi:MAG: sulfatase-like hydrolase/transferase, partial [Actinomycetota bacterium]